jgi:uncharacterized protein (DUF2236 family)
VIHQESHLYQSAADGEGDRGPILPPPDEWNRLAVGPDSITWQRSADTRLFLASGTALLLQVAHPTVGAGVSDYSNFRADPWGRLLRTLDFTNVLIYAGPQRAAEMGSRIREFHKRIKGKRPDGTPYHALEPEAYAWVHGTLAEAIVRAHAHFGRPFERDEVDRFWTEWRGLGRFLGVRWDDLPERWDGFQEWVEWMIDERLEHTAAVDEVFESLMEPTAPPIKGIGPRAWNVVSRPGTRLGALATAGLLPDRLRRRLELRWTRAQALEFRAAGAMARSATPLMTRTMLNLGPSYLKWRRKAIARGDVASLEQNPHLAA